MDKNEPRKGIVRRSIRLRSTLEALLDKAAFYAKWGGEGKGPLQLPLGDKPFSTK